MFRVSGEGCPQLGLSGQQLVLPAYALHSISTQTSQGDESSQEKARGSIRSPRERMGVQDGRGRGLPSSARSPVSGRLPGGLWTRNVHQ